MRLTAANGVDVLPLLEQVADALDANARTRVRTLLTDVQTAIDQGSHARSLGGGAMAVLDEAAKAHSQLEQNLDQDISRDVAIGMKVEVIFREEDDVWIPNFRPLPI